MAATDLQRRSRARVVTNLFIMFLAVICLVGTGDASAPPPVVTLVSPNSGHPTTGGVSVMTVQGNNFGALYLEVRVDGALCSAVNFVSVTEVNALSPPGSGAGQSVAVIFGNQTNPGNSLFTYAPPTVVSVNPASGNMAGGYTVTITGTNFGFKNNTAAYVNSAGRTTTPLTAKIFGRACQKSNWISDTVVTCVTVPNSGTGVSVNVEVDAQTSAANTLFSHPAPTLVGLSNTIGTTYGGNTVTVTGTNFGFYDSSPVISLNGNNCSPTKFVSDTAMLCVVPKLYSAQSGIVAVTISSKATTSTAYTYTFIANHTAAYVSSAGQTYRLGDDASWAMPAKALSSSVELFIAQEPTVSTVINTLTNNTALFILSARMYRLDGTSTQELFDLDGTGSFEALVPTLSSHYLRLYQASVAGDTWYNIRDIGVPTARTVVFSPIVNYGLYTVAWSAPYVASFSPAQANPKANITFTGVGFGGSEASNLKIWARDINNVVTPCADVYLLNDTQAVCTLPDTGSGKAYFILEAHGFNYSSSDVFIYRLDGTPNQIIEAKISGTNLVVEYVKDSTACYHLVLANDVYLTPLHSRNFFCNGMDPVVITTPLSNFGGNLTIGSQVRLVHGNNGVLTQTAAYSLQ